VIPHSAFKGQTPDEMYLGSGDCVPDRLAEARALAREQRIAVEPRTRTAGTPRPRSPHGADGAKPRHKASARSRKPAWDRGQSGTAASTADLHA
jgi:hypothetical protein